MRVLAAPDKYKGSATAAEVASAIAAASVQQGHTCRQIPLADGGDGTIDAMGGPNRVSRVTGPLEDQVDVAWRLDGQLAVVEMARASGLTLAGGRDFNDPVSATSRGTGELIAEAYDAGAHRVIVGMGGAAATDGGLAATQVLDRYAPFNEPRRRELVVACDVTTKFVDAAHEFGPQKGATPDQVGLLHTRLLKLQDTYRTRHQVDLRTVPGAGAAGGLAGGLAALGARLVPGFPLVAEHVGLEQALADSDLVVTGEGHLDHGSFSGKVVGGVATMAQRAGVPIFAVVGGCDHEVADRIHAVSLVNTFGHAAAFGDTVACIEAALSAFFASQPAPTS